MKKIKLFNNFLNEKKYDFNDFIIEISYDRTRSGALHCIEISFFRDLGNNFTHKIWFIYKYRSNDVETTLYGCKDKFTINNIQEILNSIIKSLENEIESNNNPYEKDELIILKNNNEKNSSSFLCICIY